MKIKAKLEPGKIAIVTGGSSGIGKAVACELVKSGMDVWLVAQRKDLLELAREEVETHRSNQTQKIGTFSADISDWDQVRATVQFVTEKSGAPDLLVNSAGVTHPGYVEKLDLNIFNWMMEVNYFGTVNMTKEVLTPMIQRNSGFIVNISSMAGYIGVYGYTAYGASKFAVRGFSDALRSEMRFYGIGVSTVFPPDTDTPQLEYDNRFKPPETKAISGKVLAMSAEAVAGSIIKGIKHGEKLIFPNFDSQLIFRLNCILGGPLASIEDWLAESAKKKLYSSPTKER